MPRDSETKPKAMLKAKGEYPNQWPSEAKPAGPSLGPKGKIAFFVLMVAICCRKGDPFQGPKGVFSLILENELSRETRVLTKQETLLGSGTQAESSRVREPRNTTVVD